MRVLGRSFKPVSIVRLLAQVMLTHLRIVKGSTGGQPAPVQGMAAASGGNMQGATSLVANASESILAFFQSLSGLQFPVLNWALDRH